MFGDDGHLLCHQVGGVETDTELSNHGDVSSSLQSLHKGLGARLGDGAQVVDEVGLGHADASVYECDGALGFVGNDVNLEVFPRVQFGGVCETFIADFIQSL